MPVDATNLSLTLTPAQDSTVLLSANGDLFTGTAGYNQDLAISVSGMDPSQYPDGIVAWKESGGRAGTMSPNAAYVHAVVPMRAGTTYTVSLKWKTNTPAAGASIFLGAGATAPYSPTELIAEVIPPGGQQVATVVSSQQYQLTGSDGWSWVDLDPAHLAVRVSPSVDELAVISGNADLWTATAGYNQDLGIAVSGADPIAYPDQIVGWKESGGFAGTFSPNAAAVTALYPLRAGGTYLIKLQWKTNRPANGATIYAGAGGAAPYSPTRLTVGLLPGAVQDARSTRQYRLVDSDGHSWQDMDPAALGLQVTPKASCQAILSANADLWTETAGYNQDIAIAVDGVPVAWKESGGRAGTFSPNAAMVQALYPMSAGRTYRVTLQWKTNISGSAAIRAGAGSGGPYSPTSLRVQLGC
jgi:hypothetical protein